ncbi:MAG: EH signature domain-containing protein [Alphaproteobacteria bacterium]
MAERASLSLRDVIGTAERRSLPPTPFAAPRLATTASELANRWSGVEQMPTLLTIEEVVEAFKTAFAERRFDDLQARHWRWLPFALWHGDPSLGANASLLDAYEHRLRGRRSRRDLKGLIGAYLRDFAPARPGFMRLANLLAEQVPAIDWPWRDRHRDLKIFDPRQAPDRLGDYGLNHADGPIAALDELGLSALAARGLPLAALQEVLHDLRESLSIHGEVEDKKLGAVLDWALAEELGLAPPIRVPLAHALLLPWAGPAAKQPPPELLKRLRSVLLKHYGDPRVRRKSWLGVDGEALKVFKRWMVEVAIEQFLEVIDRLALEKHWIYRRAFWTAYLKRDWIHEADVMFGKQGYALAHDLFGKDAPCARLTIGSKPRSKRVEPGHAVLLLHIGRLIVADWSHDGYCAIWNERDGGAPVSGKSQYTSDDVDAFQTASRWKHDGSASYSWQKKVRDYISDHTGFRLTDHEFHVEASR